MSFKDVESPTSQIVIVRAFLKMCFLNNTEKWKLQKLACDNWIKIELRLVLVKFRANLSFAALSILLRGL